MSYTIKDNSVRFKMKVNQNASLFLRVLADEVIKISTPKTPKDTGRLRMDVIKQVLGLNGKIKWGKRYAIYQEKKQFRNYTTPGTGPHFAEDSVREAVSKSNGIARKVGLI